MRSIVAAPVEKAKRLASSLTGTSRLARTLAPRGEETRQERLDGLKALVMYYEEVGLYERVAEFGQVLKQQTDLATDLDSFANPAQSVVEFHAGHLFPGNLPEALPIKSDNDRIAPAVHAIDEWSNFGRQKQALSRWIAIREGYIRVGQFSDEDPRAYKQVIDPRNILVCEMDGVGTIKRIVYQYTTLQRDPGAASGVEKEKVYTEEWDLEKDSIRFFLGEKSGEKVDELDGEFDQATFEEFGIDFVPFVRAPFSELVPGVSLGSFELNIDLINNLAASATRLDSMLFRYNRSIWGLEGTGVDANGRPFAPPVVQGSFATSVKPGEEVAASQAGAPGTRVGGDTVKIDKDAFYRLPAGWSLKSLVADVDFRAAQEILDAKWRRAQRKMPELLYSDVQDNANEAGVSVRYKLGAAIDRVVEARGNAEAAVVEANVMCLRVNATHNVQWGDVKFSQVGDFDKGELKHWFAEREVMPASALEREQTQTMKLTNAESMRRIGYPEEEIKKYLGVDELEEPQQAPNPLAALAGGGSRGSAAGGASAASGAQSQVDSILNRAQADGAASRNSGADNGATPGTSRA